MTDISVIEATGDLIAVRTELMRDNTRYRDLAAKYLAISPDTRSQAEHDAASSALMATTFSYVIAAVLGRMRDTLGEHDATVMAQFVEGILDNGDDDESNADVFRPA